MTDVVTTIKNDYAWVVHHLILIGIVGALVVASVYGVESVVAKHDHANALQMQALAQTLVQQNQITQQQTKAQIDALTQQNVVLQQQMSGLTTAIANRDAQLILQQNKIPQMSPDQLSVEWQKDIKNAGNIKPSPSGGYSVDQQAAVATVQLLEEAPVLHQDIEDLRKSNMNLGVQLANETVIYEDEKKSHGSDNALNKIVLDAKNAEIKDIKAQCRKSKLKFLGIGIGIGIAFAGRLFGKL